MFQPYGKFLKRWRAGGNGRKWHSEKIIKGNSAVDWNTWGQKREERQRERRNWLFNSTVTVSVFLVCVQTKAGLAPLWALLRVLIRPDTKSIHPATAATTQTETGTQQISIYMLGKFVVMMDGLTGSIISSKISEVKHIVQLCTNYNHTGLSSHVTASRVVQHEDI